MYFKIWISYNGFHYSGIMPSNQKNIKGLQDHILETFNNYNIKITYIRFKSRTDAKVNAYMQYFIIETELNITNIFYKLQLEILKQSNNKILFHKIELSDKPIKTYEQKTYIYKIINYKSAVTLNTHFYFPLNRCEYNSLKLWLQQINNEELNYQIFCKELKYNKRPVIQKLKLKCQKLTIMPNIEEIWIYCTGLCFMYKQVRMIIGTLLKILKKNIEKDIVKFISNFENKKYVYTAPAHALYLYTE